MNRSRDAVPSGKIVAAASGATATGITHGRWDTVAFGSKKSKKAGPFRVTVSKSGVTGSVGGKVARVSSNTKRGKKATMRVPGTKKRKTWKI